MDGHQFIFWMDPLATALGWCMLWSSPHEEATGWIEVVEKTLEDHIRLLYPPVKYQFVTMIFSTEGAWERRRHESSCCNSSQLTIRRLADSSGLSAFPAPMRAVKPLWLKLSEHFRAFWSAFNSRHNSVIGGVNRFNCWPGAGANDRGLLNMSRGKEKSCLRCKCEEKNTKTNRCLCYDRFVWSDQLITSALSVQVNPSDP